MSSSVRVLRSAEELADFLLNDSEGAAANVVKLLDSDYESNFDQNRWLAWPMLMLPCRNKICHGIPHRHNALPKIENVMDHDEDEDLSTDIVVVYRCAHCETERHAFALTMVVTSDGTVTLFKFGQSPPRGGPLPSAILNLADSTRKDLLRKGLECERHSLGVGAFAYYRKAFEEMRGEIFDEIEKHCKTSAQKKAIAKAKREPRTTESFKLAAAAMPPSLKEHGDNAMSLLYAALSVGIHGGPISDEECLGAAKNALRATTALLKGLKELKEYRREIQDANKEMERLVQTAKSRKPKKDAAGQEEPTEGASADPKENGKPRTVPASHP